MKVPTSPLNAPIRPAITTPLPAPTLSDPVATATGSTQTDINMKRSDLQNLILPLPAFLAANSNQRLLETSPLPEWYDPHQKRETYRFCYRLDRFYFSGVDTSLDEPLLALMRGSRRGQRKVRDRLMIATEFSHATQRGLSTVWSALVFSVSRRADREECLSQVNAILGFLLRGNIRPLDARERATLGRTQPCRQG